MNNMVSGIRRFYLRQKPVAVTDLAAMATCEQRLVLEKKHGRHVTEKQRKAMDQGTAGHEKHDAEVRHVLGHEPVWNALRIGVMLGIPLPLIGELLLNVPEQDGAWLRIVGAILAAPGLIYSILTGNSVFASSISTGMYLLLQVMYYSILAFFFLILFQPKRRAV